MAQIDTAHYVTKPVPTTMRFDTNATNLLTYNQITHVANLMSGTTLTNYFRMGLLSSAIAATTYQPIGSYLTAVPIISSISKSANYTIVSGDFGTSKVLYITVDCTSGNLTVTMPSNTTFAGYTVYGTKSDVTANTVTFSGVGSDNIIGTKGQVKQFIPSSSTWTNN